MFLTLSPTFLLSSGALCPGGTYQPAAGATACEPCPPGTAVFQLGSVALSSCSPCLAGSYAPANATAACTSCPPGSYSSAGAVTCELCPLVRPCLTFCSLGRLLSLCRAPMGSRAVPRECLPVCCVPLATTQTRLAQASALRVRRDFSASPTVRLLRSPALLACLACRRG